MCLTNNYSYKTCLASLNPSASAFEYLLSSSAFTCPDNLPIPYNPPAAPPRRLLPTTSSATLFDCLSALEPPRLGPRPAYHRRPRPPPGCPPAHAGPRRRLPLQPRAQGASAQGADQPGATCIRAQLPAQEPARGGPSAAL